MISPFVQRVLDDIASRNYLPIDMGNNFKSCWGYRTLYSKGAGVVPSVNYWVIDLVDCIIVDRISLRRAVPDSKGWRDEYKIKLTREERKALTKAFYAVMNKAKAEHKARYERLKD
jgi:protoheme ferro-lyase